MEASTQDREDVRRVGDGISSRKPDDLPESVEKLATQAPRTRAQVDDETASDALEWLLSDAGDDEESISTRSIEINVGTPQMPNWISWTIRNVDRVLLRQLQDQRSGSRAQRRGGQMVGDMDPERTALRIVSHGTVEPDLDKAADVKKVQRTPDPHYHRMQILAHRFRNKPGLIDQLAGEIFDLSGYDEGAIREAKEVRAAGN
jgi:hypothetical protein